MQPSFAINHRKGNLHIEITGVFDCSAAVHLAGLITAEYRGHGNIFIHTNEVLSVHPEARQTFGRLIGSHQLPRHKLYLTGRLGPALSPDRVKIIAHRERKKSCRRRCRNCNCQTTDRDQQHVFPLAANHSC